MSNLKGNNPYRKEVNSMGKCVYAIKEEDKEALMKDLLKDSGKILITNSLSNCSVNAPSKKNHYYKIFNWNFPKDSFIDLKDAMDNYSFLCIAIENKKK